MSPGAPCYTWLSPWAVCARPPSSELTHFMVVGSAMEQMEICRTAMGRLPCIRLLSRWVIVCMLLASKVSAGQSITALVTAQQMNKLCASPWH